MQKRSQMKDIDANSCGSGPFSGEFWMFATGKLFCLASFRVVLLPLSLRLKLPGVSKGP